MGDDQYDFEERAAILEYDAGMTRPEAEKLAREWAERRQKTAIRRDKSGRRWLP